MSDIERERERDRQREKQAPCREPDAEPNPRTLDHDLSQRLNHLGAPLVRFKQKMEARVGKSDQVHSLVQHQVVYNAETETWLLRDIAIFPFGSEDRCNPTKI